MTIDGILIRFCWLYYYCSIIIIFNTTITFFGWQFFHHRNLRGRISKKTSIRHPFYISQDWAVMPLWCLWIISLTWRTWCNVGLIDNHLCWVQRGMLDCFFFIWGVQWVINIFAWFLASPHSFAFAAVQLIGCLKKLCRHWGGIRLQGYNSPTEKKWGSMPCRFSYESLS